MESERFLCVQRNLTLEEIEQLLTEEETELLKRGFGILYKSTSEQ